MNLPELYTTLIFLLFHNPCEHATGFDRTFGTDRRAAFFDVRDDAFLNVARIAIFDFSFKMP